MGTNYYLHRKSNPCGECGHDKNAPVELHIGKSSMGWVWLWQGHKDVDGLRTALTGPEEWFRFLAQEIEAGAEIRDEYSQTCSLEDLTARVTSRRGGRRNMRDWTEHIGGDDLAYEY